MGEIKSSRFGIQTFAPTTQLFFFLAKPSFFNVFLLLGFAKSCSPLLSSLFPTQIVIMFWFAMIVQQLFLTHMVNMFWFIIVMHCRNECVHHLSRSSSPLCCIAKTINVFAHYNDLIWTSQWQFFLYSLDTRE